MSDENLKDIADQIEATGKARRLTVRELLAAIGQERRGIHVTSTLRKLLRRHRLKCEPDFGDVPFDAEVILSLGPKLGRPSRRTDDPAETESSVSVASLKAKPTDPERTGAGSKELPSHTTDAEARGNQDSQPEKSEEREVVITVRKGIPAGNRTPVQIRRNEEVFRALSRMNDEGLDHLVVTNGPMVEGIFSWRSYSMAMLCGRKCETVGDCLSRDFNEVREDKPLFDAVRDVIRHGVAVVRGRDSRLCGLVTQRDAAEVFVDLAEPFLFLGQIENHLRDLVERMNLSRDEFQSLVDVRDAARAARAVKVDDLTLGELIRAIEKPEFWERLNLNHDRNILLQRLARVRDIRNKVMHFDADPILASDKEYLTETRRILQEL